MIGDGDGRPLPDWVSSAENQEFLYVSDSQAARLFAGCVGGSLALVVAFGVTLRGYSRGKLLLGGERTELFDGALHHLASVPDEIVLPVPATDHSGSSPVSEGPSSLNSPVTHRLADAELAVNSRT